MKSNKKILLIRLLPKSNSKLGGRELLDNLIHENLKNIFQKNFSYYSFKKKNNFFNNILLSVLGYLDGSSPYDKKKILKLIDNNKINFVFISGSNYGKITEIIKLNFPKIKIIIFHHNVEVKFFLDSFKIKKNIKSLLVLIANFISEKKSVKNSDYRICLTRKDSKFLKLIYGKGANSIIPLALKDGLLFKKTYNDKINNNNSILFVGGNYYGNMNGIRWFIENVLPKIKLKLIVIGNNIDDLHNYKVKNLKIKSNVKNLYYWYKKAKFIISPVFFGSGMKTKLAESLMYGKKIIGTSNSFIGYEKDICRIGLVSNTINQFVKNIKKLDNQKILTLDKSLRKIYLKKYSPLALKKNLTKVFNNSLLKN